MIAAALGSTGTRTGVPDLALDPRLVDCVELDSLCPCFSHIYLTSELHCIIIIIESQ